MPISGNSSSAGPAGLSLKAYGHVKADGTLLKGMNVAIAKGGAGVYDLTFTSAMATAVYVVIGRIDSGNGYTMSQTYYVAAAATGTAQIVTCISGVASDLAFHFEVWE